MHRATPFKIYSPPGEDFGKVYHRGECEFTNAHTFYVIFRLGLSPEQVSAEFISAKWAYLLEIYTPPEEDVFLNSSTGDVYIFQFNFLCVEAIYIAWHWSWVKNNTSMDIIRLDL